MRGVELLWRYHLSQKPETRFRQGKVLPFLRTLKNTYAFPIQQVAVSGDPDYVLCINGYFVALELKAEGGKPSPLQNYKLTRIIVAGGIAIVVEPSNWEQVKQALTKLSQEEA